MRHHTRAIIVALTILITTLTLGTSGALAAPAGWACQANRSQACVSQFGYTGQSTWNYPVDAYGNNCTNYAAFRLSRNGAANPGNLGNAINWDENARAKGFPVDTNPAVGTIAQWNTGTYGHVAYVDWVSPDGQEIAISETSYEVTGYISSSSRRVLNRNNGWPSTFIHIKDGGPSPVADSDGDGVPDSSDRCPTQAGSAITGGCPDSDGDSTPDVDDTCPTQKGWTEFQGCPAESVELRNAMAPDINGDGRADFCRAVGGLNNQSSFIRCTLATASGFGPDVMSPLVDWGYAAGRRWADFDGNGTADFCRVVGMSDAQSVACTTTKDGAFSQTYSVGIADWGYAQGRDWVDVNADGKADFCRVVGDSNNQHVSCSLSTGTGFGETWLSPALDWGYPLTRNWTDFNGDGRADFCRAVGGANNVNSFLSCTLTTATGFGATVTSALIDWGYQTGRSWSDANDDGKADYCRVVGVSNDQHVSCTLSAGSAFGATITSSALDWGYEPGRGWADFDGDGNLDFCRVVGMPASQGVQCTLFKGSSFGPTINQTIGDWGYTEGRAWTDANDDGKADFCRVVGMPSSPGAQCTLSTGTAFGATVQLGGDWGYPDMRWWTGQTVRPHLRNLAVPSLSGTVQVGSPLTANPGSWSQSAVALSYQWQVDGVAVPGATSATYVPAAADVGKRLRVQVTATKKGYQAGSTVSGWTVTVPQPPTPPAPAPSSPTGSPLPTSPADPAATAPPTSAPNDPSATPTATPNSVASKPSRPRAPRVVVRGRQAVVTWTAPAANGATISRYQIDISRGRDKSTPGSTRKVTYRKLTPGRYRIRIAATNAHGTSVYSAWRAFRIR